ncbi:MAG: hypothetical protein BWY52_02215 [Chloroflexi bacterium ADurb.Bin325]|nr:MAG: hypothetical protein BWY52_02215 [Chloroflexi bacterium ADurb.Bin325]
MAIVRMNAEPRLCGAGATATLRVRNAAGPIHDGRGADRRLGGQDQPQRAGDAGRNRAGIAARRWRPAQLLRAVVRGRAARRRAVCPAAEDCQQSGLRGQRRGGDHRCARCHPARLRYRAQHLHHQPPARYPDRSRRARARRRRSPAGPHRHHPARGDAGAHDDGWRRRAYPRGSVPRGGARRDRRERLLEPAGPGGGGTACDPVGPRWRAHGGNPRRGGRLLRRAERRAAALLGTGRRHVPRRRGRRGARRTCAAPGR